MPVHQAFQLVFSSFGALAVAIIFYSYREYMANQMRRDRILRERVAYMLWEMAKRMDDEPVGAN